MSSSSWPSSLERNPPDSSSSSGGFIVYVVVVISIAGLALLGALVRVCIRKSIAPPGLSAGQVSAQRVSPLRPLPEYEAKTVTNPDGSISVAMNLKHPVDETAQHTIRSACDLEMMSVNLRSPPIPRTATQRAV
ncbi:hypothetical protein ABBQ38_003764 [Trebouxia sp. C0009 RCD-2024]